MRLCMRPGTCLVLLLVALCMPTCSKAQEAKSWPTQFNATLIKVNPFNHNIVWTKFYYDWVNRVQKFDFLGNYFSSYDGSANITCSILFVDNNIWNIFPGMRACRLAHKGIGPMVPWWVNGSYVDTELFKGVWAQKYELDVPLGPVYYWSHADTGLPLRSTNQANDPGSTDYVDVQVGPSDKAHYVLPEYCLYSTTEYSCG